MPKNLIIGKNSNLSKRMNRYIDNSILLSSREILENINILQEYKNQKINIIFNNFQPATQLNNFDSSSSYITNAILITSLVLDYFKNADINKIIYTSSSSVYGNNILCNESDELKPMNLHASLKVANEKLIEKYCNEYKIDYTITRIFNMYGGNDKFSVISKIINAHKNNQEIKIVNNGNAIRDFIHIDDVVFIYSKLLKIQNIKILNVGTGFGSSIKGILEFLSNNQIEIKTSNIFRDELKVSTSDARLLVEVIQKNDFINVKEYLQQEFNL
ncbi:SDR family oxidoreductase [Sulfurimonas sp. NW7]|uniref:SDR family oxidoreductase n=1 Tax=Sulfurimonas sp. NW7 TaxID=2922727 RepID=UPI003DA8AF78